MIKKTVVCDRCKKGKPFVIIPKSKKLPENEVLCKECANYYYEIEYDIRCDNCGDQIVNGPGCKCRFGTFCSSLCAIQYAEGHNGNDEQRARYFSERDERMLLGENEED